MRVRSSILEFLEIKLIPWRLVAFLNNPWSLQSLITFRISSIISHVWIHSFLKLYLLILLVEHFIIQILIHVLHILRVILNTVWRNFLLLIVLRLRKLVLIAIYELLLPLEFLELSIRILWMIGCWIFWEVLSGLLIFKPFDLVIRLHLFSTFRNWLTTTLGLASAVFSSILSWPFNCETICTIFRIDNFRNRRLLIWLN